MLSSMIAILFVPLFFPVTFAYQYIDPHTTHPLRHFDPGKRKDSSPSSSGPSGSASQTSEWVPSPSSVSAAKSQTTALLLAQSLLKSSVANCTVAGGGCSMFNYTLVDCTADDCACEDEITLAAMVCAQCNADSDAVDIYNQYLTACKTEGVANPSDTIVITVPTMSAGQSASGESSGGVFLVTSTIFATSTLGSADSSSTSGTNGNEVSSTSSPTTSVSTSQLVMFGAGSVSLSQPPGSSLTTLSSISTSSMGSVTVTTPSAALLLGMATSSAPSGVSTASMIMGAQTTITSELSSSVLALNAAIGFFSSPVDSKCVDDCGTWRGLSNTCTQDLCICTDPGVLSASACSQCLGTTTHGDTYAAQMGYYNGFIGNCTSETNLSPSVSGQSGSFDIVAAATSQASTSATDSSGSLSSSGGPTVKAEGASEMVVTKVAGALPVSSPTTIGLAITLIIPMLFLFGFSLV